MYPQDFPGVRIHGVGCNLWPSKTVKIMDLGNTMQCLRCQRCTVVHVCNNEKTA